MTRTGPGDRVQRSGLLALLILVFVTRLVESGVATNALSKTVCATVQMFGYMVLIRLIDPAHQATVAVAEACER